MLTTKEIQRQLVDATSRTAYPIICTGVDGWTFLLIVADRLLKNDRCLYDRLFQALST